MPHAAPMIADELLKVRFPDKSTELARGFLVVREKPGFRHGAVSNRLGTRITDHVDAHGLGLVLADTGYQVATNPDTVRADGTETLLGEHETLDGEDVLPGFTCPLGAIW